MNVRAGILPVSRAQALKNHTAHGTGAAEHERGTQRGLSRGQNSSCRRGRDFTLGGGCSADSRGLVHRIGEGLSCGP